MPLSKAKQAAWMRAYRGKKKRGGTALLPKALVKKMLRLGLDPARYVELSSVSLDDYHDLERRLKSKTDRVEWQSGGIKMLREEIATLKARLATQPAMQEAETLKRILTLEADQALHEAQHGHIVEPAAPDPRLDVLHEQAVVQAPKEKPLTMFQFLHPRGDQHGH